MFKMMQIQKSSQINQNSSSELSPLKSNNMKPSVFFSMLLNNSQKAISNQESSSLEKRAFRTPQLSLKKQESLMDYQNSMLRQQNKALKKQLSLYKGQSQNWTADSSRHQLHQSKLLSFNPKQMERVIFQQKEKQKQYKSHTRQLQKWIQVLKKQCKVYEETIQKMDQKIASWEKADMKWQEQKRKLEKQISQINNKFRKQKNQEMQKYKIMQEQNKIMIKQLKDKTNYIMEKYGELESEVNNSQIQWAVWKQKWGQQKLSYLQKISDLQRIIKQLLKRQVFKQSEKLQSNEHKYRKIEYELDLNRRTSRNKYKNLSQYQKQEKRKQTESEKILKNGLAEYYRDRQSSKKDSKFGQIIRSNPQMSKRKTFINTSQLYTDNNIRDIIKGSNKDFSYNHNQSYSGNNSYASYSKFK